VRRRGERVAKCTAERVAERDAERVAKCVAERDAERVAERAAERVAECVAELAALLLLVFNGESSAAGAAQTRGIWRLGSRRLDGI
jgi:plasmid stabilization system protein ParE